MQSHTHTQNTSRSYAAALTASLTQYAQYDSAFRNMLQTRVAEKLSDVQDEFMPPVPVTGTTELLCPRSRTHAEKNAEWLIGQIHAQIFPDTPQLATALKHGIYENPGEMPKNIVLGFLVGVILGPTAGKFKNKEMLSILLREDIAQSFNQDVARRATQTAAEVIARSLRATGGNVHQLDPDTADWLFGNKEITFFSSSAGTLHTIARELLTLSVPHVAQRDEQDIAILAVSPAVNAGALECLFDVLPLEQ